MQYIESLHASNKFILQNCLESVIPERVGGLKQHPAHVEDVRAGAPGTHVASGGGVLLGRLMDHLTTY